jgi:hypothetical protein
MNQSRANTATRSSVPGSSKRWVAPGTTVNSRSPGIMARARANRDRALDFFQQVLKADVADIQGGTTA